MSNDTKKDVKSLPPAAIVRVAMANLIKAVFSKTPLECKIFANRVLGFLESDLACVSVYALSENYIDSQKKPDPNERSLSMNIDIIVREGMAIDDELDILRYIVETAIYYEALKEEMNKMFTSQGYEKIDFELLEVGYSDVEIGMLADDALIIGCASLTYEIQYKSPKRFTLPDFTNFYAGWDITEPDGKMEIEDKEVIQKGS